MLPNRFADHERDTQRLLFDENDNRSGGLSLHAGDGRFGDNSGAEPGVDVLGAPTRRAGVAA